jgi:glyoxylase-like metal-dependent hydrolase (beta-lactamase superfamily II)
LTNIRVVVVGMIDTNCYILSNPSTRDAIIVDAGGEPRKIISAVESEKVCPKLLVSTHAHFDHVLAVDNLRSKYGIEFRLHVDDLDLLNRMQERTYEFLGVSVPPPPVVDNFLDDGEGLTLGDEKIEVIHTPGHSPGSISLRCHGFLLSGDALFAGSVGRTDGPGGNMQILVDSIRSRILSLPESTRVYPGHGPSTSVLQEKLNNPFVGQKVSKYLGADT